MGAVAAALVLALALGLWAGPPAWNALWALALNARLHDPGQVRVDALEVDGMGLPTCLRFGPDGRLYVANRWGSIRAWTIERTGPAKYRVTAEERIEAIREMPNHGDDGVAQPDVVGRLTTGLLAGGAAAQPWLLVSSSDPRMLSPDADSNSGVISRLERVNGEWLRTDLVRGLPRSWNDHAPHGLALDASGRRLYVVVGATRTRARRRRCSTAFRSTL